MIELHHALMRQQSQEHMRELLEGPRQPGVALEVTGTPARSRQRPQPGLSVKPARVFRKSRV